MSTDQPESVPDSFQLPSFRALYCLTGIVALLVAADMAFWFLGYESLRNPLGLNLSLLAALLGGGRIVYGAVLALMEGEVGADLALAIAMVAALLLKEYWVAAEVVLIAMVGESLEALTVSRTHREIRRIFELQPRMLHLRRDQQVVEVPLEEVCHGDVVVVRPGERVAVDGTVLQGRSAVDQSTLTGESLPVDKGVGDEVFAGTMNQFGALEVRAERIGGETTLGRVIQLVADARKNKSRAERLADRMARYFLPLVLTLAAGTFVVTNRGLLSAAITGAETGGDVWIWMPTLAVLVVSCPCALILATPAAVMAALAWLARRGVLTTGGAALERLAGVTRFAFDKTGTLTEGQLEVGQCYAVGSLDAAEVLRLAASAEVSSEHHIGRALVGAAQQRDVALSELDHFETFPGAGVAAQLANSSNDAPGASLLVGNQRFMSERNVTIPPAASDAMQRAEAEGQTPLLLAVDGVVAGVIAVRDRVRPEAADVLAQLRRLGIGEIVMLTGDRQMTARQVADAVGVDRFEANLLPEEKANWLADWSAAGGAANADRPRGSVAMVGDGVNDAPALACADVGIALGGVGADITAEAGDLILMGDPLSPLPGLVRLSRETVRIIRQNILLFGFGVNLAGIVLTAWIMPGWSPRWHDRAPVAAALFHQAGSLLVLLNAMRLLWFERWEFRPLRWLEETVSGVGARLTGRVRPAVDQLGWVWSNRAALLRLGLLLLLAVYLTQIVVFVQPDEVAIVKRFGRFQAVLGPGAHLRLPPPWDVIERERPQRIRTVGIGLAAPAESEARVAGTIEWNTEHPASSAAVQADEVLMLTGDQSLVELTATLQYRIADVRSFRFAVRQPERTLAAITESVARRVIASHPLSVDESHGHRRREILTVARGDLEAKIAERVQLHADRLGLGIQVIDHGFCFREVHPPLPVVDAFRDVSNAFKEKEEMRNQAEAYYRDRIIKAAGRQAWQKLVATDTPLDASAWRQLRESLAGEAAAELNLAAAYAAGRQQQASGEVEAFRIQEAAHGRAPQLTEWRLLIDAMAETLPAKRKLILDEQAGGRRHLLWGLPQNAPLESLPLFDEPTFEHEE